MVLFVLLFLRRAVTYTAISRNSAQNIPAPAIMAAPSRSPMLARPPPLQKPRKQNALVPPSPVSYGTSDVFPPVQPPQIAAHGLSAWHCQPAELCPLLAWLSRGKAYDIQETLCIRLQFCFVFCCGNARKSSETSSYQACGAEHPGAQRVLQFFCWGRPWRSHQHFSNWSAQRGSSARLAATGMPLTQPRPCNAVKPGVGSTELVANRRAKP